MFRIKEIINDQEQTIGGIAEKVGIAQPSMSNIANGKTTPSIDMLQRIADALGVHISELFNSPDENQFRCPKCGATLEIKEKV